MTSVTKGQLFSFLSMKKVFNLIAGAALLLGYGCTPVAEYDAPATLDGIRAIVVSEGQFGYGTSSLTSLTYQGEVEQDLFRRVNNRPMGDVAQSMTKIGNKLYVPLNNSRKVEVMNAQTFQSIETMTISHDVIPMYVCHLGGDSIAVTDQKANSQLIIMDINHGEDRPFVRRTISLGGYNRSFQMQLIGNKLFVGADRMTVFDLGKMNEQDKRELKKQDGETIQLTDFSKIVVDKNGMLWALGHWQVFCIDPKTETTVYELNVGGLNINSWTSSMDISPDGSTIYFNSARRVYTIDVDHPQVPANPIIAPTREDGRTVYNMCVSKENTIFLCEVLYGSLSRSRIYEYEPDGTLVQEFRGGIFSHYIYFN